MNKSIFIQDLLATYCGKDGEIPRLGQSSSMLSELEEAGSAACSILLKHACTHQRLNQWDLCRNAALLAREYAWEKLHRHAYGVAGLLVAVTTFLQGRLDKAIYELDLVALMAGDHFQYTANIFVEGMENHAVMETSEDKKAGLLTEEGEEKERFCCDYGSNHGPSLNARGGKNRGDGGWHSGRYCGDSSLDHASPITSPTHKKRRADFRNLPRRPHCSGAGDIRRVRCPPLATFQSLFMETSTPVILTGVMDQWPAMGKPIRATGEIRAWSDLSYLRRVAGRRTVPVEVGGCYTADGWRQELITVDEFISRFITTQLNQHEQMGDSNIQSSTKGAVPTGRLQCCTLDDDDRDNAKHGKEGMQLHSPVGYLAQHQLLDQIPSLRQDIVTPDYCALLLPDEEDCDGDVVTNVWFGPGGTVSPLHNDPTHNLLAQVVGSKRVFLVDRKASSYVYPIEGLLSNTSQVDPASPDLEKFPLFADASPVECVIQAGEMLYIPPLFWHHIEALKVSFSVSFWWGKHRALGDLSIE